MKAKLTMYKHIGRLCEPNNGYVKEFNLVSWNNREPVYDIRTWNINHTEWKEGIVITHNEMFKFQRLLEDYLHSENHYISQRENVEKEAEELRKAYICFVSDIKAGHFNEEIYNIVFECLNQNFELWREGKVIPMRVFQVCIDLMYLLSKNDLVFSVEDVKKLNAAKNEIYGLLMGFE